MQCSRCLRATPAAGSYRPRAAALLRCRGVVSRARQALRSQREESQLAATAPEPDDAAFTIACMRLRHLLYEAAWDTNEAVRAELSSYTPAMKLTFLTNCASFITLLAMALSWLTGEDPLGGVTLTSSTVHAAEVGLLAAVPLVSASLLLRTSPVRRAVPLVADLHATQANLLQPLLSDLNLAQLLIASSCTVLPMLLLLFPAMHGLACLAADMAEPDVVVQPVTASVAAAAAAGPAPEAVAPATDLTAASLGSEAHYGTWGAWQAAGMDLPDDVEGPGVALEEAAAGAWVAAGDASGEAAMGEAGGAEAASALPAWTLAALHNRAPLSPPLLLPQGVPDLLGMLQAQVVGLLAPDTAHLMRGVVREATGLAPAILSGFVAAYTVMRQLAPRGSQVRAIRDALTASDRYFRLHVSMSRLAPSSAKALQPQGTSATTSTSSTSSVDSAPQRGEQGSPAAGSAPQTPRHSSAFINARSEMLMAGAAAAAGGAAPGAAAAAPLPGSTDDTSQAVSDAFRKVAVLWLLTRRKVCQLAYMLTALNILLYALLWQETGNLATPATTAIVCVLAELWLSQQEGRH